MKRASAAVLLAAVAVAAAGCGGSRLDASPAAHGSPRLTGPPSLGTVLRLTRSVPCLNARQRRVGPAAVSRFHAVTAVICSDAIRTYPDQGQWEVFVRRVAVSSVTGLQEYFEQPSVTRRPKNLICSAVAAGIVVPVLVDRSGRWLVPKTPVDACNQPLGFPHYGRGSTHVRWHVVRVHRVKQLVSAAALAAGCPMKVGNTVAWAGPREATSGGPLFPRTPKIVRICIYRTRPDQIALGHFVRGFRLDAARTRRLLKALTGPGPRRGCPKQRMFAGVGTGPRGASVELGGCWRVERPDRTAGTAKPGVVRAILGAR